MQNYFTIPYLSDISIYMRTSRTFVFLVGVTLVVAPIFSSVWAQQSERQGAQTSVLLEIQALRAEIAELRDMVERQQYQLRRMQQGQTQRSPYQQPQSPQYSQPQTTGNPGYTTQVDPAQNTDPSVAAAGGVAQTVDPANPNDGTGLEPASTPDEDIAPAFVEDNRDFYQPYSPSEEGASSNNTASAVEYANNPNQVVVDERVLNPSTPYPGAQQNSGYPPVVDRSVGGQSALPATDVTNPGVVVQSGAVAPDGYPGGNIPNANPGQPDQAGVPAATPVNGNPSFSPGGVDNSTVQPNNANTLPATGQVTAAPGGVIAVPGAVAPGNPNVASGATITDGQNPAPNTQQAAVGGVQPGFNQQAAVQTPPPAPAPVVLAEQDYYQRGFNLLKQSQHQQAVDMFKQQIVNYPQGSYADDAHYWIAESMYVNRSLDESKLYFRAIISNFAQSPRLPDAMLKTAYIEQEQGNEIEARILLQEIIQYHPRSNAAISAKNRLAELD